LLFSLHQKEGKAKSKRGAQSPCSKVLNHMGPNRKIRDLSHRGNSLIKKIQERQDMTTFREKARSDKCTEIWGLGCLLVGKGGLSLGEENRRKGMATNDYDSRSELTPSKNGRLFKTWGARDARRERRYVMDLEEGDPERGRCRRNVGTEGGGKGNRRNNSQKKDENIEMPNINFTKREGFFAT